MGKASAFHRGREVPLAGDRTFDPWTVTFYSDQAMAIRQALETWSDYMNNYLDNTAQSINPDDYKGIALVSQLDRQDKVLQTYLVGDIFPLQISEIQLAWDQNDVVQEFSVTFAVGYVDPATKQSVTQE
jgi:hypothetical protein